MKPTRTYILIACLFASLGAAAGAAGTNTLAARAAAAAARLDAASAAFERGVDARLHMIRALNSKLTRRQLAQDFLCKTEGLWCGVPHKG